MVQIYCAVDVWNQWRISSLCITYFNYHTLIISLIVYEDFDRKKQESIIQIKLKCREWTIENTYSKSKKYKFEGFWKISKIFIQKYGSHTKLIIFLLNMTIVDQFIAIQNTYCSLSKNIFNKSLQIINNILLRTLNKWNSSIKDKKKSRKWTFTVLIYNIFDSTKKNKRIQL